MAAFGANAVLLRANPDPPSAASIIMASIIAQGIVMGQS
jgi:hypothetical protein